MSRRRTLFLCLLWLSTATAHADALPLRWQSDRQSVQLRQPRCTRVSAGSCAPSIPA